VCLAKSVREGELIDRIDRALGRRLHASREVTLGIGDDAALFRPRAGYELILTCDWFLEGTHFLRDRHPPDSVGWKCLARALSDVAAMGGVPSCFLLSLAIPAFHTRRWLDEFLGGLRRASRRFGCVLAGGDTTHRKEILINIAVVGEVRTGRAVPRSGARPGDLLYVSGNLGEAELGLRAVKRSHRPVNAKNPLTKKHLYPEPRLALGQWLTDKRLASAMMDLSDGLSSDLPRLCAASGVGARLEGERIPQTRNSNVARKFGLNPLELAWHGGDDYELLFTVPPQKAKSLPQSFQGLKLTPIGRITRKAELVVCSGHGRERPLPAGGWDPFRKARELPGSKILFAQELTHNAAPLADRHAMRGARGASMPLSQ
jgi:thiamine-monophosphate kinase